MTSLAKPETKPAAFGATLARMRGEIEKALAGAFNPDQFMRVALTQYRAQKLESCDSATVLECIVVAAQLGLSIDPALGEFYIIPRNMSRKIDGRWVKRREATWQIGYRGLLKRGRRCPGVVAIDAGVIREGDTFRATKGLMPNLFHEQAMSAEPRAVIGSYAIAHMSKAPPIFYVADVADIEKARSRSEATKAEKSSPWDTDYDRMAQKTAIRRLMVMLPTDDETRKALVHEEILEAHASVRQETARQEQRAVSATAKLAGLPAAKCDGNHGEPACSDSECWQNEPPASYTEAAGQTDREPGEDDPDQMGDPRDADAP